MVKSAAAVASRTVAGRIATRNHIPDYRPLVLRMSREADPQRLYSDRRDLKRMTDDFGAGPANVAPDATLSAPAGHDDLRPALWRTLMLIATCSL